MPALFFFLDLRLWIMHLFKSRVASMDLNIQMLN